MSGQGIMITLPEGFMDDDVGGQGRLGNVLY